MALRFFNVQSCLVFSSLVLLASGCAHHKDVRPGAGGVHKVSVRAEEKHDAERSAISQAEHYCESLEKHYAVISESTKYTGSMDENTRNTLRRASTAASVVGAGATNARRNREFHQNPGSGVHVHADVADPSENPIGTVGTVGSIMTGGKDYLTEMSFRCE